MSNAKKGEKNPMFGQNLSEDLLTPVSLVRGDFLMLNINPLQSGLQFKLNLTLDYQYGTE